MFRGGYQPAARWIAGLLCLISAALRADEVALLNTGQDAGQARIDTLRTAREIYVSTFILEGDASGMGMLAMLRDAARRGAKVHLLLDAENINVSKAVLQNLLTDPTLEGRFEIKVYRPFRWAGMADYLKRMHDKLHITVDGEGNTHAITGGRNLGNEYFNIETHRHFRDADIYVKGEGARSAKDYFLALWNSRYVGPLHGRNSFRDHVGAMAGRLFGRTATPYELSRIPAAEVEQGGKLLDAAHEKIKGLETVTVDKPGAWTRRVREVGPVRFSHDDIRTNRGSGDELLRLIREARESIFIANAYVILPREFRDALRDAARRGVKVTILTNNARSNDMALAQAGFENDLTKLLSLGTDVYELRGPHLMHKKVMVVDGKHSYVGTFNMDPRGYNLNLEEGMTVTDERFAEEVMESLQRELARSALLRSPSDATTLTGCAAFFYRVAARFARSHL